MKFVIAFCLISALAGFAAAGCGLELTGKWQNELGSLMVLNCTNQVCGGTFTNAVGDDAGPYEVMGRQLCDGVFTLSVYLSKTGYILTWTGRLAEENAGRLVAPWTMVSANAPWWSAVNIGFDTFGRASF